MSYFLNQALNETTPTLKPQPYTTGEGGGGGKAGLSHCTLPMYIGGDPNRREATGGG